MDRVPLIEALRAFHLERGLNNDEAEREAQHAVDLAAQWSRGDWADIHVYDFYLPAKKDQDGFYVAATQLEALLRHAHSPQANPVSK